MDDNEPTPMGTGLSIIHLYLLFLNSFGPFVPGAGSDFGVPDVPRMHSRKVSTSFFNHASFHIPIVTAAIPAATRVHCQHIERVVVLL